MQRVIIPAALVVFLLSIAGTAVAQEHMTGLACSECHTMHNSQGGLPMRWNNDAEPLPILLLGSCIECHTLMLGSGAAANAALASAKKAGTRPTPFVSRSRGLAGPPVMAVTPPTYTWGDSAGVSGGTLAGGSFYWVPFNDAFGHNVTTIPGIEPDRKLGTTPPGGENLTTALQCSGINGCHGNNEIADPLQSLQKAHHGNLQGLVDGKTVGGSYRFLLGVRGVEDEDWEWTVSGTDHNLYVGEDRVVESRPPSADSLSGFCAKCHGNYHNSASGSSQGVGGASGFVSPWVRHPSDYDMVLSGDFAEYVTYNSKVPLARTVDSLSSGTESSVRNNQRIVMCLSCHRAHGSPYNAMLRWNYREWPGSRGQNGCQICHTSK